MLCDKLEYSGRWAKGESTIIELSYYDHEKTGNQTRNQRIYVSWALPLSLSGRVDIVIFEHSNRTLDYPYGNRTRDLSVPAQ